MNDKVIELEEYRNLIENKNWLDNKTKTIDDLSLEELEDLNKLYKGEVSRLSQEVNVLQEENKRLRKFMEK